MGPTGNSQLDPEKRDGNETNRQPIGSAVCRCCSEQQFEPGRRILPSAGRGHENSGNRRRPPPEESNNTQRDPRRNPASSAQQKAPLKKKSLKQLTDEELLAKAMEMEMESGIGSPAGNTNASAVVAPYFSPPPPFRPSGPPPSMGGPPPSMMAPPHHRPFLPPYIRGPSAPPYNHPPPAAAPAPAPGGYRPRHKNNR